MLIPNNNTIIAISHVVTNPLNENGNWKVTVERKKFSLMLLGTTGAVSALWHTHNMLHGTENSPETIIMILKTLILLTFSEKGQYNIASENSM